ncbi:MAG: hypothetical protein E7312_02515 [Clostridiales bacterium]|nr:hypothetical protein [Clostridiales bacterium]
MGERVELFHCSGDPHSLDGVRLVERDIALVDATSPHVVDPKYPGAIDEIINLGQFWSEKGIIEMACDIVSTQSNISYEYSRAYKYLNAASYISADTCDMIERCTDNNGINSVIKDIISNYIAKESETGASNQRKLFASAVTPAGLINYCDTLLYDCKRVVGLYIGDDKGEMPAADRIMNRISIAAKENGYAQEIFYCPMMPNKRIEHIVIPELELGFTVIGRYSNDETVATKIYNLNEHVNRAMLRGYGDKISENDNMYRTLLLNAQSALKDAYWLHNTLESYYVPNIDFDGVEKSCNATIDKILNFS